MKPNKNNIETIFKDQFQDFEVAPADHLWENISKEISKEKKSKKVIPLWYWGSGIAASLVLLFGLFTYFNSEEKIIENQIVFEVPEVEEAISCPEDITETENSEIVIKRTPEEKNSTKKTIPSEKQSGKKRNSYSSIAVTEPKNTAESIQQNIPTNYSKNEKAFTQNTNTKALKTNIKEIENTTKENYKIEGTIEEKADDVLLAEILKESNNKPEEKSTNSKKWGIQPQVGSFYYNSFAGSLLGDDFSENPQNIDNSFSYGVRVAYQDVTPKLKVRTGVTYNSVKFTTASVALEKNAQTSFNDIFDNADVSVINVFSPGTVGLDASPNEDVADEEVVVDEELESVDDFEDENITADEQDDVDEEVEDEDTPTESNIERGQITQQLSYIEIPIEVAYTILERKISLDLLGGMSTFILTNSDGNFEANNNNETTQLGEIQELSTTSFTVNVGLSANYYFIENLSFNVEPILKVQFNSLTNNSGYSPFFLGVSSGLTWKF